MARTNLGFIKKEIAVELRRAKRLQKILDGIKLTTDAPQDNPLHKGMQIKTEIIINEQYNNYTSAQKHKQR